MTHSEIQELVAGYALDALDTSEEAIVADHLGDCPTCLAEYHSLLVAVDGLAAAPLQEGPPASLRARMLASAAEVFAGGSVSSPRAAILPFEPAARPAPRPGGRFDRLPRLRRFEWLAAAVLVAALSVTTVNGLNSNRQNQAELSRDQAALALLTSTETTNDMLLRGSLANVPATAHGHWFHRTGVMTQVVVGEFLAPAPAGQHYEVWLLQSSGWSPAGQMDVDASGYGRIIVLGSDGSGIRSVEVTLEQGKPSLPSPAVALHFP